jgi:hypothetical protein
MHRLCSLRVLQPSSLTEVLNFEGWGRGQFYSVTFMNVECIVVVGPFDVSHCEHMPCFEASHVHAMHAVLFASACRMFLSMTRLSIGGKGPHEGQICCLRP